MADNVGTPSPTDQFAGYWMGADGQWRLVDANGVPPGYWRASDGNWYPPSGSTPGHTSAGADAGKIVGIVVGVIVGFVLIAIVCIAAITLLGNNASTRFEPVGGSIGTYEGP
jgi:hypothetical protein